MTGIEQRLRLLEDERAILATLYRYGHALDYGAEADWLDCFTADAGYELHYRGAGGHPTHYQGRAELAAFVHGHSRAPERFHKHLLVEPIVEVTGGEAAATSYFLRVDDRDGERHIYAFGRYLDRLVRGPDRRWRFSRRIAEIESRDATSAPRRTE
jgi:hypothetical protein